MMMKQSNLLSQPRPLVLAVACLIGGSLAFSLVALAAKPDKVKPKKVRPAGTIKIDAWTFDRGNAGVSENPGKYGDYRDKHPELILTGDGSSAGTKAKPWFVEYDIDVLDRSTRHDQY
jgi:hypothetical protein